MRLTRLKIIRHRWCAPTELFLGAKRQLVLGKNGTGKTRLLELIARVCAGDLPWLMAEPIEFEADWSVEDNYLLRTGVVKGTLRLKFSCTYPAAPGRSTHQPLGGMPRLAHAYTRPSDPELTFEVRFIADSESAQGDLDWRCANGQVFTPEGSVEMLDITAESSLWGSTIFKSLKHANDRMKNDGIWDDGVAKILILSEVSRGLRFDEAGGGYDLLRKSTALALETADPDGSKVAWVAWYPTASLLRGSSVLGSIVGNGELTISSLQLKFLEVFGRLVGYVPLDVRFRLVRSWREYDQNFSEYDDPRVYFSLLSSDEVISDKDLSFGEKRTLSFLAYLWSEEGRHIIIADELMNGLHHSLGVALLDEIGDRQAFLATHEPVLMDEIDFESADELRRSLIHCERNPDPKGPPFLWTQIDEAKAERMFRDYRVASLKQGHELLRDWGIW